MKSQSLKIMLLFCGILLPLIILGSLVAQVQSNGFAPGDLGGLHAVHRYASPQRDAVVAWATNLGGLVALPALLLIAWGLRYRLQQSAGATFFAVTVAGAWGLNVLAKLCFHRARPTLWQSPTPRTDYSFPSGHAMIGMAIAVALIILAWPTRLRWLVLVGGLVGVLGVGVSRLYLGVHFPSDVLAGWCAGLLWTLGVYAILLRRAMPADLNKLNIRTG